MARARTAKKRSCHKTTKKRASEEERKKRKSLPSSKKSKRPAVQKQKRSSKSRPKARPKARVSKKKAALSKKKAALSKKKRVPSRSKKRASRRPRSWREKLSPQQAGAITRARKRLEETPRRTGLYLERKKALIQTYRNAGAPEASIRSIMGWVTRETRRRISSLAAERELIIGARLHGADPQERAVLMIMMRELDERFTAFIEVAEQEYNLDYAEAVDFWFSPEAV